MKSKFSQSVFVEKTRDTFLEYETLQELLEDQGDDYTENLVGYFPVEANVTYEELQKTKEETKWTVAYHKGTETGSYAYLTLVRFNSTLELKRQLESIIQESRGEDYVVIYRDEDIVGL